MNADHPGTKARKRQGRVKEKPSPLRLASFGINHVVPAGYPSSSSETVSPRSSKSKQLIQNRIPVPPPVVGMISQYPTACRSSHLSMPLPPYCLPDSVSHSVATLPVPGTHLCFLVPASICTGSRPLCHCTPRSQRSIMYPILPPERLAPTVEETSVPMTMENVHPTFNDEAACLNMPFRATQMRDRCSSSRSLSRSTT